MQEETDNYVFPMTDAEIDAKHVRLRGSMSLKYPRREACCVTRCCLGDNDSDKDQQHQCFLASGHTGDHEFSSECGRIQPPVEHLGRLDLIRP